MPGRAAPRLPWIVAAEPAGDGYLTITVTPHALGGLGSPDGDGRARRCAQQHDPARHDGARPALARSGRRAHLAERLAGPGGRDDRSARAGGGRYRHDHFRGERGGLQPRAARDKQSPVYAAVAYLGASSVRYRLARTLPGSAAQLARAAPAAGARRGSALPRAAGPRRCRVDAALGCRPAAGQPGPGSGWRTCSPRPPSRTCSACCRGCPSGSRRRRGGIGPTSCRVTSSRWPPPGWRAGRLPRHCRSAAAAPERARAGERPAGARRRRAGGAGVRADADRHHGHRPAVAGGRFPGV